MERVKATNFGFRYDRERYRGISRKVYNEFERRFNENSNKFTEKSKFIDFYPFTRDAFREAFRKNIGDDFILISLSIVLVATYSVIVLGGCSPIHMRTTVAAAGIITIAFAYTSCQYIAFALGH